MHSVTLRPYQAAAIADLQDGDLLVSPTGTGKTRMLCAMAEREAHGGGFALWVAHRHELLHQASQALRDAWLTPEMNVLVRSIQELRKGVPIPGVTLLIWDEAHHAPSDDWSQLRLIQYPLAGFIGATATPERGDGRGMGSMFKRIVETITVRDAIDQGYLVQPTVLRPARPLASGELAQDPVDAYLEHARGTKAIVFCSGVEIAIEYATRFRDYVPTAAVWGDMPAEDRKKKLAAFARGELLVLTSVSILTEGFDVPDVETCILARGFGTAGGYLQAVGRVLRPSVGKTRALVLDLRGTSHDWGDPDEPRSFHLEGAGIRRPSDGVDVRFCPVCGSPSAATACETCGYEGELRRRKPRVLGLPLDRFARQRQASTDEQIKALAQYIHLGRTKNYKIGWAIKRWEAVHGRSVTWELKRDAMKLLE